MPDFRKFTRAGADGGVVYVNPEFVAFVGKSLLPGPEATRILLSGGASIEVTEIPTEVIKLLCGDNHQRGEGNGHQQDVHLSPA